MKKTLLILLYFYQHMYLDKYRYINTYIYLNVYVPITYNNLTFNLKIGTLILVMSQESKLIRIFLYHLVV